MNACFGDGIKRFIRSIWRDFKTFMGRQEIGAMGDLTKLRDVAARLRAENPGMSPAQSYAEARKLVNATVEPHKKTAKQIANELRMQNPDLTASEAGRQAKKIVANRRRGQPAINEASAKTAKPAAVRPSPLPPTPTVSEFAQNGTHNRPESLQAAPPFPHRVPLPPASVVRIGEQLRSEDRSMAQQVAMKPMAGATAAGATAPKPDAVWSSCAVCGRSCTGGQSLSNGAVFHQSCHESLEQQSDGLRRALTQARLDMEQVQRGIDIEQGPIRRMRRWFANDHAALESLEAALSEAKTRASQAEAQLHSAEEQLRALYDYWLDYPPDWDMRRRQAIEQCGGVCVRCGLRPVAHLHHTLAKAEGGSNRLENLEPLCFSCHSQAHPGIDLTGEHTHKPTRFAHNVEKLQHAIEAGAAVRFSYMKFDGERSTRTIDPQELVTVGRSLCVRGHCHLRHDERTFAIKRIRSLRIVND